LQKSPIKETYNFFVGLFYNLEPTNRSHRAYTSQKASYIIVSAVFGTAAFLGLATLPITSAAVAAMLMFAANLEIATADLLCEGTCVAAGCSVLQWSALGCSGVQWDAVGCSGLQWVAVDCSGFHWVAVCCSVLQCVAVSCSGLQWLAVGWSGGQWEAVSCSVL